jgi:antitoxin ChpS
LYHNERIGTLMSSVTLRKWGGAVAVSLPKKVLALLELDAGSQVEVKAEQGKIVLSPARPKFSLAQLLREQARYERKRARPSERAWVDSAPRGKELL